MKELWPWIVSALLGIYHGLNPGMGWLFAVALGLQERSRRAVIRAFWPIVLGHAASIAVVVALVAAMQAVISPVLLKWIGAGALIAFGVYKLVVPLSCPRWVGMRVGFRDLAVWSFLMATACGAGLMLVPVLLKLPATPPSGVQITAAQITSAEATASTAVPADSTASESRIEPIGLETRRAAPSADSSAPACHAAATHGIAGPLAQTAAVGLHMGAMFLAMAVVALVVYEKLGLAILRRAWFNLDLLWAGALIGAGLLTLLL